MILAATRLHDPVIRTSLSWIDPIGGEIVELLTLPSGGDTSYPGMVWYDNTLWISYYSSHETKTSIYLAKVAVSMPGDANGDGKVDGSDVTILADNWQAGVPNGDPNVTWEMGDFNGDQMIDGSDVTILADN